MLFPPPFQLPSSVLVLINHLTRSLLLYHSTQPAFCIHFPLPLSLISNPISPHLNVSHSNLVFEFFRYPCSTRAHNATLSLHTRCRPSSSACSLAFTFLAPAAHSPVSIRMDGRRIYLVHQPHFSCSAWAFVLHLEAFRRSWRLHLYCRANKKRIHGRLPHMIRSSS